MSHIYTSSDDAFHYVLADNTKRSEKPDKSYAIYGGENESLIIIEPCPSVDEFLFDVGERMTYLSFKYGDKPGRRYSIHPHKTAMTVVFLHSANKDDLLLFMSLASPKLLNNPDIQTAINQRLSALHRKELSASKPEERAKVQAKNEKELQEFQKFFDLYKGAVEVQLGTPTFFPAGYNPEKDDDFLA